MESCNLWLAEKHPDGRYSLVDGCHSREQDVAKALHLWKSLNCIETEGRQFEMIRVQDVPAFKGKVNEEAISTLNKNLTPHPN